MADTVPTESTETRYLTTEQVAAMTGFSIKALEMMRYREVGPSFRRVGRRRIRYRLSEVVAWLERERVACSK